MDNFISRKCKDNIKMDLKDLERGSVDWIYVEKESSH
jgi:hypothetical protein